MAGPRHLARRPALLSALRAGQTPAAQDRACRPEEARDAAALAVRRADLRSRRVLPARDARTTAASGGTPQSWTGLAPFDVGRRAGRGRHENVPLEGRV